MIGPLSDLLRDRDIVDVLQDKGVTVRDAQTAAEGLRRGASLLVVNAPQSSHDQVLQIIDRHHPITLDSLGETYLEPGWSRADRIAGDDGVLEVADDLLNAKRPGEDFSAFRPLAPGNEELVFPARALKIRTLARERSKAARAPVRTVELCAAPGLRQKNDPENDEPPRARWQRGFLAVRALPHVGKIPIQFW